MNTESAEIDDSFIQMDSFPSVKDLDPIELFYDDDSDGEVDVYYDDEDDVEPIDGILGGLASGVASVTKGIAKAGVVTLKIAGKGAIAVGKVTGKVARSAGKNAGRLAAKGGKRLLQSSAKSAKVLAKTIQKSTKRAAMAAKRSAKALKAKSKGKHTSHHSQQSHTTAAKARAKTSRHASKPKATSKKIRKQQNQEKQAQRNKAKQAKREQRERDRRERQEQEDQADQDRNELRQRDEEERRKRREKTEQTEEILSDDQLSGDESDDEYHHNSVVMHDTRKFTADHDTDDTDEEQDTEGSSNRNQPKLNEDQYDVDSGMEESQIRLHELIKIEKDLNSQLLRVREVYHPQIMENLQQIGVQIKDLRNSIEFGFTSKPINLEHIDTKSPTENMVVLHTMRNPHVTHVSMHRANHTPLFFNAMGNPIHSIHFYYHPEEKNFTFINTGHDQYSKDVHPFLDEDATVESVGDLRTLASTYKLAPPEVHDAIEYAICVELSPD